MRKKSVKKYTHSIQPFSNTSAAVAAPPPNPFSTCSSCDNWCNITPNCGCNNKTCANPLNILLSTAACRLASAARCLSLSRMFYLFTFYAPRSVALAMAATRRYEKGVATRRRKHSIAAQVQVDFFGCYCITFLLIIFWFAYQCGFSSCLPHFIYYHPTALCTGFRCCCFIVWQST